METSSTSITLYVWVYPTQSADSMMAVASVHREDDRDDATKILYI